MNHLILSFYILSFSTGLGAISVTCLMYVQYKKITSKYNAFLLLALTLQMATLTINKYVDMHTTSDYLFVKYYSGLLYLIGCLIFITVFPFLIHGLTGIHLSGLRKKVILLFASCNVIAGIYYAITHDKRAMFYIIKPFITITFSYGCIITILYYKSIADKLVLKFIKTFFLLTVIFWPLFVIEIYRSEISLLKDFHLFEVFTLPLYFILFNVLSVIFSVKFFKQPPFYHDSSLTSYFITRFNITGREIEIMSYLLQGLNNTEISKKLFISGKTVENHLSNIYDKVDVKNRVQLVNFILSNK